MEENVCCKDFISGNLILILQIIFLSSAQAPMSLAWPTSISVA